MEIPSGLTMMLKAFGISIPPETLEQINTLIPHLPSVVSNVASKVNTFDQRLAQIEAIQIRLLDHLKEITMIMEEENAIRNGEHSSIDSATRPTVINKRNRGGIRSN